VEPPAGIDPATPSLPWNHQEPLCGPPFPQVTPDRRGRSYRFSFGQVMRSLQSRLIAAGAGHHPAQRPPTQAAFLFDHLPLALGRRPQQSSEYKGSSARRSPPRRPPPRSVRSMAMGMSSAGGARRTRSARLAGGRRLDERVLCPRWMHVIHDGPAARHGGRCRDAFCLGATPHWSRRGPHRPDQRPLSSASTTRDGVTRSPPQPP
jgi:hypothetical protein